MTRPRLIEEGRRYRLRPIATGDAAFMLRLRLHAANRRYIHPTDDDVSRQRAWIRTKLADPSDHSFILEERVSSMPRGSFSIYEHDPITETARYGRWLTDPTDRGCVAEFAWLGMTIIFERLRLASIHARIPERHRLAIAFQERIGARRVDGDGPVSMLEGGAQRLVEYRLERAEWPRVRALLEPLATRGRPVPADSPEDAAIVL